MNCPVCNKPRLPWLLWLIMTPGRTYRVCDECAAWVNKLLTGRQTAVEVLEDRRLDEIIEKARGEG